MATKRQGRGSGGRFTVAAVRPESLVVKAISFGPPENAVPAQSEDSTVPRGDVDPREFIRPPFDPATWAAAMERSTRLGRCVRIKARYVAGMGWAIMPGAPGEPARAIPNRRSKVEDAKFITEEEALRKFFARPNRRNIILASLLYFVWVDKGATGNGYLEVTRDARGKIDGLHHAPAVTMRVRTGGRGFIQIRQDGKRYFKDFGDETIINAKTGKPHDGGSPLPLQDRATEILQFKDYSPRSTYYGVPVYVSAAPAIAGSWFAALRNVAFFENDAVPRIIITVSGGKLAGQSMDLIEGFLRKEGKGPQKAHRALLLQADPKKLPVGSEGRVEIKVIPLTVGSQEDASFSKYQRANDDELREAFGITEPYFGTSQLQRASAETGRRITEDGVFEPERVELETTLNLTVVVELGATAAQLELVRPQSLDALESINGDERMARAWAITVDEMRANQGKPPMEDKEIGSKPYRLLEAMATAGGMLGIPEKAPKFNPRQPNEAASPEDQEGRDGKPAATSAADQPEARAQGTRKPRANAPSPEAAARPRQARKDLEDLVGAMSDMLKEEGLDADITVCESNQAVQAAAAEAMKTVAKGQNGGQSKSKPRVYVVGGGERDTAAESRVEQHLNDPVVNGILSDVARHESGGSTE